MHHCQHAGSGLAGCSHLRRWASAVPSRPLPCMARTASPPTSPRRIPTPPQALKYQVQAYCHTHLQRQAPDNTAATTAATAAAAAAAAGPPPQPPNEVLGRLFHDALARFHLVRCHSSMQLLAALAALPAHLTAWRVSRPRAALGRSPPHPGGELQRTHARTQRTHAFLWLCIPPAPAFRVSTRRACGALSASAPRLTPLPARPPPCPALPQAAGRPCRLLMVDNIGAFYWRDRAAKTAAAGAAPLPQSLFEIQKGVAWPVHLRSKALLGAAAAAAAAAAHSFGRRSVAKRARPCRCSPLAS